jgi:hypothetical protein
MITFVAAMLFLPTDSSIPIEEARVTLQTGNSECSYVKIAVYRLMSIDWGDSIRFPLDLYHTTRLFCFLFLKQYLQHSCGGINPIRQVTYIIVTEFVSI